MGAYAAEGRETFILAPTGRFHNRFRFPSVTGSPLKETRLEQKVGRTGPVRP